MTKYYLHCEEYLIEKPLNKNNWWYVQLDSTIRTIYNKYKIELPEIVIVKERTHFTTIYLFRGKVIPDYANYLINRSIFILDELQKQAEINSISKEESENWIKYEFKLL